MAWQTLSLHFKQTYDGAYRYLDRCGEFMLAAVEKMNFMPGEPKPTGAKLEIPERGLNATIDALELAVVQELPDDNGEFFFKTCSNLAALAAEHFTPKRVLRNGFASKSYWPMPTAESPLAASLTFGDAFHVELGKSLGMVPAHKKIDCNFSSGSMDLHILLHPVTFEKISVNRHTANFKASSAQKQRVDRLNKFADRFSVPLSHALMLELDLMEAEPPQGPMDKHFNELKRQTELLRNKFVIK